MTSIFGYIRTSNNSKGGPRDGSRVSGVAVPQGRGAPLANIYRDVGVSGFQERQGWHRIDGHLTGGDTLVAVVIDRVGRTWQDTVGFVSWRRPSGPPLPGGRRRRTKEGLERTSEQGKVPGPPRKFTDGQVEAILQTR